MADPAGIRSAATPPRWLVGRSRPGAAARLYCFPHSGGSTGEYVRWAAGLPGVEVWGVQLPGRGTRLAEPPVTRMPELVEALLAEVRFVPPFALFGHSLGALVAFEVARGLRDRGREAPGWLFASGYQAPQLPRTTPPVHGLADDELFAVLDRQYGLPAELRTDAALRRLALPAYRADLAVAETYRYRPGRPLDCPLVVVAGAGDDGAVADLAAWRIQTTGPFRLRLLAGGHFYLREQRDALLGIVADTLAADRTEARD